MDDPSSYFKVGTVVSCTTSTKQKIQGEVMSFDPEFNLLSLKSSSAGKPGKHDVRVVNLNFVEFEGLKKISDPKEEAPSPQPINHNKVQSRCREKMEEKKRKVSLQGIGVSPDGQRLIDNLEKLFTGKCRWDNQNILVKSNDEVTILPPYTVDCCQSKDPKLLEYIKKLVGKNNEQPKQTGT